MSLVWIISPSFPFIFFLRLLKKRKKRYIIQSCTPTNEMMIQGTDMNVLCSTANYTQKPYFQFRDDYRIQNGKELTKVSKKTIFEKRKNNLCSRFYYSTHISSLRNEYMGFYCTLRWRVFSRVSLFQSRKTSKCPVLGLYALTEICIKSPLRAHFMTFYFYRNNSKTQNREVWTMIFWWSRW